MAENSGIEWTHHTFNPWWGCVKISPACTNCYAATLGHRYGTEWGPSARRRFFGDAHWNEPLKWNRKAEAAGERHRVFCASMADVFEALPDGHPDLAMMAEARERLWELIERTPWLNWLLLTKRPERVMCSVPERWRVHGFPENVWPGTTVEDQKRGEERIPMLMAIPAAVRFLSCEPLLGPVDVAPWLFWDDLTASRLDWVIAGGESGPGARPSHPEWFRSLRDQCTAAGVPFFFKQWGEWVPYTADAQPPFFASAADGALIDSHSLPELLSDGNPVGGWWLPDIREDVVYRHVGKKAAGRLLDGREWSEFPVSPAAVRG